MHFKRFDQARPFLTLGVVIAAWLVLPVAFKSFMRVSFYELQAPITVSASYVRSLQDYWSLRNQSKKELIEAGRDLARINAFYSLAVQENQQLREGITRLEDLLRVPGQTEYRFEHARVARRDFSAWWQRLTTPTRPRSISLVARLFDWPPSWKVMIAP